MTYVHGQEFIRYEKKRIKAERLVEQGGGDRALRELMVSSHSGAMEFRLDRNMLMHMWAGPCS